MAKIAVGLCKKFQKIFLIIKKLTKMKCHGMFVLMMHAIETAFQSAAVLTRQLHSFTGCSHSRSFISHNDI